METRSGGGAALTARLLTPGVHQMRPKATTPSAVLRACDGCATMFTSRTYHLSRGQGRFCSHPCYIAFRSKNPPLEITADGLTALVPIRRRDGSIRCYALIDAADAEFVNRWRWSLENESGYVCRGVSVGGRQRTIRLHRELLGLPWVRDHREGDHIDRVKLNCRRSNLRVVVRSQGAQNKSSYRGSSSRFRGVSLHTPNGKWHARVQVNGKEFSLGYFYSEEEAGEAARIGRRGRMPWAVD